MIARSFAPMHFRSVGVSCCTLDSANTRLAVARTDCSLEMWVIDSQHRFEMVACTGAFRKCTPRGIFFLSHSDRKQASFQSSRGVHAAGHPNTSSDPESRVVVVTLGGQFLVYDAHRVRLLDVVTGVGSGFFGVAVNDRTRLLAAAASDGTCHLYNLEEHFSFLCRGSKAPRSTSALCVCFAPKGTHVYVGDDTGAIQSFDVTKCPEENIGTAVLMPLYMCEIHRNNSTHASKRRKTEGKTVPIWGLAHALTVPHLIAVTETGCVVVVHATLGQQLVCFSVAQAPLTCIAVCVNDFVVVGGTSRDLISMQPSARNSWVVGNRTRRIHSNDITCLISGDKIPVVSGGLDGDLVVSFTTEQLRDLFTVNIKDIPMRHRNFSGGFVHPSERYNIAQWSDNCHILFALARDALQLWYFEHDSFRKVAHVHIRDLRGELRCSTASPNGRYVAYATDARLTVLHLDGPSIAKLSIKMHDVVNRDVVVTDSFTEIRTMCYAFVENVGWVLFTGSADGVVRAVAMETGNTDEVYRFAEGASVIRLVVCHARNHLAILSSLGELTVWSVRDWISVANSRIRGESEKQMYPIVDVCFCSTGKHPPNALSASESNGVMELGLLRRSGHITIIDYSSKPAQTVWDSTEVIRPPYPIEGFGAISMVPILHNRSFAIQGHRHVVIVSTERIHVNGSVERKAMHQEGEKPRLCISDHTAHNASDKEGAMGSKNEGRNEFALAHLGGPSNSSLEPSRFETNEDKPLIFWDLKRVLCVVDGSLMNVDALALSPKPTDALQAMTVFNAKRFGT